ncbi:uncharacterized protein LOC103472581 isoform X3 [Poecilia reticulata]|uniref:uncharacterized protein LOC103472581 isoform X3 n=1 Tax=Poecilia reticulata TaxID=8081 RepID=UPI0004A2465E|nr:PREDICTED: uncharacterized protein LOC103472581 isoform X3 [Poecilia reticulata]
MSSVQRHRELINEQLTPAEETLTEFKEIIVKSEEETDDQSRLLDCKRTPQIILHRIDLPQNCACKEEEDFTEFSNQDGNSALDKEEPEPFKIKHEQEEPEHQQFKEEEYQLCISQDEEQLVLKQETGDILVTPSEQRINNETEPNRNQLIFHFSGTTEGPVVESQDQEGSKSEDPGEKRDKEQKQNKRCQKTKQEKGNTEDTKQKKHKKTHVDQNVYSCEFCHQIFSQKGRKSC